MIFWCFWVVEFLPKILKKVKWKFISKWPRGSLERCFLRPLSNRIVKIIYNSYCISNHEGWKCPTTPTGNALLSSLENKELEWVREDCCWKCNDDNDYHIAGGVEDTSIRGFLQLKFFIWKLPTFTLLFYTRSLYSFVSVVRKDRTMCDPVLLK